VTHRKLKKQVHDLLASEDFDEAVHTLCRLPGRQVVNPLFSFLYHGGALIRWRAVAAMGEVVSLMAETEKESARVVMRRLLWNLNDESGGIGWGSPEAMGEIMALSETMAREFAHMLVSYVWPGGNFLEHEVLQRGVLWGIGRLAQERPTLTMDAAPFLIPFLASGDPNHRGLAAWTLAPMANQTVYEPIAVLCEDTAEIELFLNRQLVTRTVGQLAAEALVILRASRPDAP